MCCRCWGASLRRTPAATATWPNQYACTRTRRPCSRCCARQGFSKRATTTSAAESSPCIAGTRSDMTATPAWLAAAEALLNRGIGSSMQGAALARRLEATALRVDILGLTSIRVSMRSGRLALIAVERDSDDDANAVLSGSPLTLVNLLRTQGAGAASAPGAARSPVQIRGDAEIANAYRELIGLARPDLEE